jgi:mannose/fructose/N-acetylgalactosamine-specific phosphotransferase system component IIB
MKRMIFRVDDRLIHGQVVEGWIKNFRIPKVIIADNHVAADEFQQIVYKSVVPAGTTVSFFTLDGFIADWPVISGTKEPLIVLFENIKDLLYCSSLLSDDIYINIGCIASRCHCIPVSDTVFLDPGELEALKTLAFRFVLHIKKLPWEKDSILCEERPNK